MSNQQNPIIQIFVGVAIAVLSTFFLLKLGLEKNNPTQVQIPATPFDNGNWKDNTQPVYQQPQPVYQQPRSEHVTIAISDRLDLDYNGKGQIAETVSIEINGETKNITLSHSSGIRDGSVSFKLPKEGYYNYNLTVTTTFNSHVDNWQICTHNGYGSGSIFMGDGKVYKMEYNSKSINSATSSYNVWLSEM